MDYFDWVARPCLLFKPHFDKVERSCFDTILNYVAMPCLVTILIGLQGVI